MNGIVKVAIAIVVVVIAWKLLKGLVGLLVGIALAGALIYGGMKLLEDKR